MKFGKSIGSQQEGHADLHYIEYKLLKKKIKDVVGRLQASELAEALTANTVFEEELAAEIGHVNQCFSQNQHDLLNRTAQLAEELHQRKGCSDERGGTALSRADAMRQLVDILQEVDQLRKYAVWNAVAVVKILKKRRKQTSFGIEDTAAERAGWLSRQGFFSGSDFAELHASIESLGHMLVLSEILPEDAGHEHAAYRSQSNQEPQQCPICLDTISDMVELSCKHRFCWKCFVLGPIAFQPGEYRITQCPICRRETQQEESDEAAACRQLPNVIKGYPGTAAEAASATLATSVPQPMQEGILTRFLHTYFPSEAPEGSHKDGFNSLDVEEEDISELVKVLVTGCSVLQQRPPAGSSSSSGPISNDFFETLPARSQQDRPLQAAQKLQWLQLAWTGDPLAVDDSMYCSLCSEPLMMEAVVCTPCKHHFHRVCINRIDKPECPLCSTALPFSWFLHADHPCAEHGFRTVSPRSYKPIFAGGPGKGNCGYPLQRPPPAALHGPEGLSARSYLHRLIPTGSGVGQEEDYTPDHHEQAQVRQLSAREEACEDDDSSSDDSGSEDEDVGAQAPQLRRGMGRSNSKAPAVYAYSAVGRMKLLCRNSRLTPQGTVQDTSEDEADPPSRQASANCDNAGAAGDQDRKVLIIGNHL